jgi:threonine aldolase
MRQSGMLAAAGLYALEHNRERLLEDHRRAKVLAQGAGRITGLRVEVPETNIVMLDIEAGVVTAEVILSFMADRGVLMVPFGPKRIRAVTHMDVDDEGIQRALGALTLAMRSLARA